MMESRKDFWPNNFRSFHSMDSISSKTIIEARNLTRIYALGDSEVIGVDTIDLRIAAGELVILKGDSGSGKSTLLSLLAGLDRPTRGHLTVATLNVLENTSLPGLLAGKKPLAVKSKAMELLDWLGLSRRQDHLPAQLSGGEMQRTAIARALINDPEIIIADEPTGNLDSRNGQIVVDLLAQLNRKWKRTVIIATHSSLADPLATVKINLKDGMISDG